MGTRGTRWEFAWHWNLSQWAWHIQRFARVALYHRGPLTVIRYFPVDSDA